MEIVSTVLTVIYISCCLFLGFVVLIQKGEGGGLGGAFGGGAVDVAFGAKADMTWKRATAAAAALFMILAIVLGILDQQIHDKSLAEDGTKTTAPETPGDSGGASSVGGASPGDPEKPADDKPADDKAPADDKPADGTPAGGQ